MKKVSRVGKRVVVAEMPIGAQIRGSSLGLRLTETEYARTYSVPLSIEARNAIKKEEEEGSYSGSGHPHTKLTVSPADDGRSCQLLAGSTVVTTVYVDPTFVVEHVDYQEDPDGDDPDGEDN